MKASFTATIVLKPEVASELNALHARLLSVSEPGADVVINEFEGNVTVTFTKEQADI